MNLPIHPRIKAQGAPPPTATAIQPGRSGRTLLDCPETTRILGVSRSKLYELAKTEPLLRPVCVGGRSVRWVSDRVEAYMARLVEEADQQQGGIA